MKNNNNIEDRKGKFNLACYTIKLPFNDQRYVFPQNIYFRWKMSNLHVTITCLYYSNTFYWSRIVSTEKLWAHIIQQKILILRNFFLITEIFASITKFESACKNNLHITLHFPNPNPRTTMICLYDTFFLILFHCKIFNRMEL